MADIDLDTLQEQQNKALERRNTTLSDTWEGTIVDIPDAGHTIPQNTKLRRTLEERHVNMIAFSATVGVGLFLQSGSVIFRTGSGLAWIAYLLTGTAPWSAMACLGEMTALFPVEGALMEMPRRFLDEGIGYAVGWMSWFAWVAVIAVQVTAIAQLFVFAFDPKNLSQDHYSYTSVSWPTANVTNPDSELFSVTGTNHPAVYVAVFLILILVINVLPIRWYGEIEYVFGVAKMVFIVGLILFNIDINRRHGWKFQYWNNPGFARREGEGAQLSGMWTGMTTVIFSMIGFELVSIAAAETKPEVRQREDAVKLATRKISLRVVLLYTLAVFTVGLNVPYDDPNLRDLYTNSVTNATASPSSLRLATSAGINALYASSRLLHALAGYKNAWPNFGHIQWFRGRLETTSQQGVPVAAILCSLLGGCLGFMAELNKYKVIDRMATHSSVSMVVVYTVICATYLRFYSAIKKRAALASGAPYDRKSPLYPYRSQLQWYRACYGMLSCGLLAFCNGWQTLKPFKAADFFPSYGSMIVFVVLVFLYHAKTEGTWNVLTWRLRADMDLDRPESKNSKTEHGRSKLAWRRNDWNGNVRRLWHFIWVWLK